MITSDLAILLLAAGSSSRLGQSKQLVTINGESLLSRSANAAIASGVKRVVVVLGANDLEHRQVIEKLPINIVRNPTWQRGMGNSLKSGLSYLLNIEPKVEAVIILVCDQPFVNAEYIKKLITRFEQSKNPVIASFYSESLGVPALFEKSLFEKILSISDQHGAKKIIQQCPVVNAVDFPEGAIDIDTEEDLKKFSS